MKNVLVTVVAALAAVSVFAADAYIESDGTSGISTGYRIKPISRIEVDFALPTTVQTNNARLFGADYNTTTLKLALGFYISANNNNPCWVVGFGSASSGWSAGWIRDSGGDFLYLDTARHTMTYDYPAQRHTYYTAGTAIAWQTDTKSYPDEATQPFAIFAAKNASGFENPCKAKIYGVKIYEKAGDDYTLVHDFVPCLSTGRPGLRDDVAIPGFKDLVTGDFICNDAAAPNFASGGDGVLVEECPGYVATGTATDKQFIDTLYHATDQTRCELDYSLQEIPTSGSGWFFSASGAENGAYFGMFVNKNATAFGRHNGTGWANVSSSEAAVLNVRRTAILDYPANKMLVLSGAVTNFEASANAVAGKTYNTGPVRLGANYNGSSEFGSFKIYGFRIFEKSGGEYVQTRNFMPCWRDGVPGLKDTITGVFVSYPGTLGTKLAYGGNIAVEANPYIQTDATYKQYLDTLYTPQKLTRCEVDFALAAARTPSDSATWYMFCGRNSNVWGAFNNKSGFGYYNGSWKTGKTTTTLADAIGIRRTAIVDNVANVGALVTAGVTNGWDSVSANNTGTLASDLSIKICSKHDAAGEYGSFRIYACRIYENNVPVHAFLPAVQDGVPGLQDQLTDTFLPVVRYGSGNNPYVYGGVFPAAISAPSSHVAWGQTRVLTASAPGAVSYRWLCNGEEIRGGTDGHLTVAWRKCPEERDSFQAIAVFSVDGLTVEGEPTAAFPVEYGRRGFVVIVK